MALPTFHEGSGQVPLWHSICSTDEGDSHHEGKLNTYCQAGKYLFGKYANDDVLGEDKAKIFISMQLEKISKVCF